MYVDVMYMGSVEGRVLVKSVISEGLIYDLAKIICEKFGNDKWMVYLCGVNGWVSGSTHLFEVSIKYVNRYKIWDD